MLPLNNQLSIKMTTPRSTTKTNKTAAPQAPAQETPPTNTDQDQATSTNPATAAVASTPEPAASPAHQPTVDTPTSADKGDSDNQEAGDDPGPNMTKDEYDALYGPAKKLEPYVASLRPIQAGLTPLQHVTAIIAGGVVGGMLARTKPYETLDLTKVAETIGMCAQLADLILDLEDNPEVPDGQSNS